MHTPNITVDSSTVPRHTAVLWTTKLYFLERHVEQPVAYVKAEDRATVSATGTTTNLVLTQNLASDAHYGVVRDADRKSVV